jgi:D-glycero-alpha-D-manno-heptose-7-phosphate kinase
MTVFAKAPLRLGLAGGGTDLSPYWNNYGGVVLSGTIDQYAYCKIEPYLCDCRDKHWVFNSIDLGVCENYDVYSDSFMRGEYTDSKLSLLVNAYQHLTSNIDREPIKITTYVEAPPGSGLGSSSALVVALVSAISEYYSIPYDEYQIASTALKIEREICDLPGGKQDQYSAAFGGFNYIEFLKDGRTIVNPLRLNHKTQNMLEMNTVLYYVGSPRSDARIIEATSNNLDKNEKTIEVTHKIKEACIEFKRSLLVGDVEKLTALMNEYWELKLQTSSKVGSPALIDTYEYAMLNGATAAKISGAGGGGHMVLFTEFENRHKLISALKKREQGRIVPFKFVKHGVDVWRQ